MPESTHDRWRASQDDHPLVHAVTPEHRAWPRAPFVGVIEAYVLRALRDLGMSMDDIRTAAQVVRDEFDDWYAPIDVLSESLRAAMPQITRAARRNRGDFWPFTPAGLTQDGKLGPGLISEVTITTAGRSLRPTRILSDLRPVPLARLDVLA